jgi:hypothetical protein
MNRAFGGAYDDMVDDMDDPRMGMGDPVGMHPSGMGVDGPALRVRRPG